MYVYKIMSWHSLWLHSPETRNRLLLHLPSDGVVTVVDVGVGVGVSAGVVEDMLLVVLLPMDSAGS